MATYWLLPLSVTVTMADYWQFLSQWLPMATLLAIAPVSDSHHGWLLAVPVTMTAYGNFIGYCPCQWQSPWLTPGSSCHNDCLWQLYWLLPLSGTVAMTGRWQSLSQWLPMATLLAIAPVSDSHHGWLLAVPVAMTAYGNFIGYCPCQYLLPWLATGSFLSQWLPMATLLAIAPVSSCRHDWLLAVFCHNDCLWQLYWLLPLSVAVAMTGYWQFSVTMTAYGNLIGYCPCQ